MLVELLARIIVYTIVGLSTVVATAFVLIVFLAGIGWIITMVEVPRGLSDLRPSEQTWERIDLIAKVLLAIMLFAYTGALVMGDLPTYGG